MLRILGDVVLDISRLGSGQPTAQELLLLLREPFLTRKYALQAGQIELLLVHAFTPSAPRLLRGSGGSTATSFLPSSYAPASETIPLAS